MNDQILTIVMLKTSTLKIPVKVYLKFNWTHAANTNEPFLSIRIHPSCSYAHLHCLNVICHNLANEDPTSSLVSLTVFNFQIRSHFKMFMNDVNKKEEIRNIAVKLLRKYGIKHRSKPTRPSGQVVSIFDRSIGNNGIYYTFRLLNRRNYSMFHYKI